MADKAAFPFGALVGAGRNFGEQLLVGNEQKIAERRAPHEFNVRTRLVNPPAIVKCFARSIEDTPIVPTTLYC